MIATPFKASSTCPAAARSPHSSRAEPPNPQPIVSRDRTLRVCACCEQQVSAFVKWKHPPGTARVLLAFRSPLATGGVCGTQGLSEGSSSSKMAHRPVGHHRHARVGRGQPTAEACLPGGCPSHRDASGRRERGAGHSTARRRIPAGTRRSADSGRGYPVRTHCAAGDTGPSPH